MTMASCQAYGEFYGVKSRTAPAIQLLLDLGVVVVGKTIMSQFADAEAPTGDFVDFHAPINPRGDGNRMAGGSSFGSGAAVGGYNWLDFTIGTDSMKSLRLPCLVHQPGPDVALLTILWNNIAGGSVRQPAAHQSVYGIRPSRGMTSLDGTVAIHWFVYPPKGLDNT